ncbi:MAG: GNAT family N-acetyltransferase [Acidimicrobiia bacterium]|nr:GNAT family N-acetyltransferase [Acidimicrobiia bacterium]
MRRDAMTTEADWWQVRAFLVELFGISAPGTVWDVRRWDGHRFHRARPWDPPFDGRTGIWRSAGRIVAVAIQEGDRDMFPHVHPHRPEVADELYDWAESVLAAETDAGRVLEIQAYDHDTPTLRILGDRGYEPMERGEVMRHLRLEGTPLPAPRVAAGYRIRPARIDADDATAFAALLNAAFDRDLHSGREVLRFREHSPSYRADLDLMAEADDGSLVASAGVTVDHATSTATFEPVLTHPGHRRRGLALALLHEGLRLAQREGVRTARVGSGLHTPANHVYDAAGFAERYRGRTWRRAW